MRIIHLCSFFLLLTSFYLGLSQQALANQSQFEKPSTLSASQFLKSELLKGETYQVSDEVKNDGLLNHYTVTSPVGTFTATTSSALAILLQEIEAIVAMQKVDTEGVAIDSLKESGENTVEGLKNLFNDPEDTAQRAAAGVRGLFTRAKETVGKRKITGAEDTRVEQLIGLSKAKGEIATSYSVSMYSRNPVLQKELDRLAMADYLGGLGVGVATSFVPGVGGLILTTSGTARLLNEAINSTPASELWLQNKKELLQVTSDEDTVELFLNNPVFSPALQTIFTSALTKLEGTENRELFIKVALQASDPLMAQIIMETAVLTAGYHVNVHPLKVLAPLARLTMATNIKGSRVIVLPTDHIIWSKRVHDVLATLEPKNSKANVTGMEIWSTGSFSSTAQLELERMGWKLHEKAKEKLLPKKEK